MLHVGLPEIVVLFIVASLVLGPERLLPLVRSIAKAVAWARTHWRQWQRTLLNEVSESPTKTTTSAPPKKVSSPKDNP